MTDFSIVVAADEVGGIGVNGDVPWHLPSDIAHFRRTTMGEGGEGLDRNAVIMGRLTYESIPDKWRPLQHRKNIVMTRNPAGYNWPDDVLTATSLDDALAQAKSYRSVFVIGGGQIYTQALRHPSCRTVVLTRVYGRFESDTFFGPLPAGFSLVEAGARRQENDLTYDIERFDR
ncbi:MAG: dihydrofolate reductase [Myxococcota bacterium]|jgi:dihydrofolate reductase